MFAAVIVFKAFAVEGNNVFGTDNPYQENCEAFSDEVKSWISNPAESEGRTGPIADWNVEKVKSMMYLFEGATEFNGDIASWDLGEVVRTNSMFRYASGFNRDIASWDVGKVFWMTGMFYYASGFNRDIASWDV